MPVQHPHPTTDRAVAKLALWLGCFGFGGGYALISQIQQQVVTRWGWMEEREFLRSVAVAQTVPGATAANLLTLIGLRVSSWRTSLLAVLLFITPSALLMVAAAIYYDRVRSLGGVDAVFRGLAPAVLAIIVAVAVRLARLFHRWWQPLLAALAFAAVAAHLLSVLATILLTLVGAELVRRVRPQSGLLAVPLPFLALIFVEISLGMFGGGYAMIAAIHHQIVDKLQWLPGRDFSDAIALSQITPGPIATAAAFIGYRLAGAAGAVVALAAIFVPSFTLTLLAARFLNRYGERPAVRNAIEALSATTVGLIFAAAASLAWTGGFLSLSTGISPIAVDWTLAAAGAAVLLIGRVNPLWVLAGTPVLRFLSLQLVGG